MTDTHTHLYMDAFAGEEEAAVARAIEAGVSLMVFPGVEPATMPSLLDLHRRFPENTLAAAGLHPTEVGPSWREDIEGLLPLLDSGECRAVGEVGIDLYHDDSFRAEQREAFALQLRIAAERRLPLIIHCREGLDDCLDIIRNFEGELPPMVFHSFTGSSADVERIREVCDPMFGINGVVTFKNAPELREALPLIGIDRIMLETDSPYLAPAPHRGSRNESAYIPLIAAKVAETLGLSVEDTEKITDENARRFFRID